jgi:hypothetical protein
MESTIQIALSEELGRAEWRNALVELGGGDDPSGDARSLCVYSENLASSGESFSLDDPTTIAVLGGRGEFFGSAEPILSGRWRRIDSAGFFPGIYRVGYSPKYVMVSVSGSGINVWEPPSRDIWRWLVVGYTLKLGDPVLRYCAESGTLDFLVPPPFQAERAALIAGTQVGTWSWQVEPSVYELIKNLTGFP